MQRPPSGVENAQHAGDRRQDKPLVPYRRQIDENGTVGEAVPDVGRNPQREARLPDTAWSGQRQQADVFSPEQFDGRGDVALPSDQRGERSRQVPLGNAPR